MYKDLFFIHRFQEIEHIWASLVAQMAKETPANTGDSSSIPGSERSPGEGNGYPLQFSCLENSMDREGCSPWGCKE